MKVNIQAIHFEIAERLNDFINKKAERLHRHYPDLAEMEVTLKVVKPETAMNKEALITLSTPPVGEVAVKKIADTFEEAIDLALEALDRQLEKAKAKKG